MKNFNFTTNLTMRKNLSLPALRAVLMVLLIVLGVGEMWASSDTYYYAKITLSTSGPTGAGSVYASTSTTQGSSASVGATKSAANTKSVAFFGVAKPNAGYYFDKWTNTQNCTFDDASKASNVKITVSTSETSESKATEGKAVANFGTVSVSSAPSNVNINATDPTASYPDASGVVVGFTTSKSNGNGDFTTGGSGDSRWTISAWPTHASATSTTFNYKFVGNGSYGTNNRVFTKTVTLKGLNDATVKTCTLTAKYPNPKVVSGDESDEYTKLFTTFKATDATQAAVEKTAVFNVTYGDNGNNFSAAFSGVTGGGTWTVTGISVDQTNQKATVTYTFGGNKIVSTHTAVLTLTANNCQGWDDTSADGGASATVTLTAENTQEATDDVLVTNANEETVYQGDFATALASYQGTGYTFKLLRNVDLGTITATKTINKAMTIDLNGKELRAAVNKSEVPMLTFSASVTVKDSKTGGKIINEHALNGQLRTITVSGGTFTLESGTLAVNNLAQYASVKNADLGVTATLTSNTSRVIHQNAGTTVNINGGKLDAKGTRSVYGIVQGSSAATNKAGTTVLNVTGGEIAVEAPYNALGIYAYGKVNMSAGVINTHITTNLIDAGYAADNGKNTNNGYGYGILMKVSVSATASSCYYGTLNMTGGTINVISDRKKAESLYNYGIYLEAAATGVGAGKTATDGTLSQKASAKASIENANITVHSNTYYSYGIIVYGSYNSYDNEYFTVPIKNCNIDVQAYLYTYAICANAAVNSTYGGCYWGDVELTGNTVTAESVTAHTAYAVLVSATTAHIFKDANTTTAPIYFGEYATAAKAVINSGTYTAKTKTTTAYAVCSSTRAKTIYDPETQVQTNRKPGGNAEAYPIVIIHGGTFRGEATTTTSRAVSSGGYTTIDGGTFEAFSTSTTAYGLYAVSGKLTASGVTISASATGTAYGAYADVGIPTGNTAQTGFAYAGEIELNNCDITATTRTSTEARGVVVNATSKTHNWTQFKADSTSNKWATTTYNAYKSVFPCTVAGHDSVGVSIAAKATINGCDIKATAGTTTAYGVYLTGTSVPNSKDTCASPTVNIKNTKFTVKTNGTTTAVGVYAGGPTTIDGCDFTVQPKTTTAKGVHAYDKKTTITNTKFNVTATSEARLFYAEAAIGSTTGTDYHGEFELGEGNECVATATGGNTAHILTLIATKRNIASGKFAGDYANASSALVTGGSYKATATGTTCYAVNLSAEQVQGAVKAAPSCTIEGGKIWALASGGTTGICSTNGVAGNILFKGGVYNVNTTLSKHIPEGLEEVPLASDRTEYGEGYRYEVDKAGMHGIDVCQIGSTKYKSLEEALQVVTSGQTIYMIANYTMATPGDYVLPSGATLLIPYKTGTGAGATTAIGASASTASGVTPSLFRKLTFANGVKLTCFGTIEASAQQKKDGQYDAWVGMPTGPYGQIELQNGSRIDLENGAKLYCWGYITGKGTINCKKGSTSLEGFQLGDWCGGTNYGLRGLGSNSKGVFPITHYAYQSIECPITYHPGSRAVGSTHVVVSNSTYGTDNIALVGTSGSMFIMDDNDASENTWVMKDYDESTDQCVWTINSGASIGNLNINISGYDISSGNFYMPITTNMSVVINYGDMGIAQNTVFLPGSKLVINKEGTAVVDGIKAVVYDASEWTGTTIYRTNYSPSWGTANPGSTTAKDAEWFVHGKVGISGNGGVYTTASGANIHSTNEDAGQVRYTSAAQGNITNHYYLQQGGTTMPQLTINPAKLFNDDKSYSSTASTAAGDVWVYENGKWTKKTVEGCFSVETTDKKHYFIQPSDVVEVNYPTQSNHTYTSVTGGRVFVWDEDCYWWEVETTPTAEGYFKAITPDHNGKYNYYYYDSSAACWKIKTITVTWNINGSNTNYSVGYGTKPEWLGATPTKTSSSSNYVWRWDGWTQGSSTEVIANDYLPYVTENTTFTAHFYEKYYEYNIIFKNSDGTILESKNWIAGTTPSYDGTPTKNPAAAETYEFNGTWDPAITTVTKSATYTAQYTATPREYTITFLNYDMSKLGTTQVVYNGTPSNATYLEAVAPLTEDPYKPDNSAFSFEFAGWRLQGASSNGFAQVKGDQTYIAQFNQTTKKYKISFVDDDGETVLHYLQLEYGATPSYTWDNPANKQDVEWNYTFSGWDPSEFATVESPQTYTAVYDKTKREYTITWLNDDDSQIDQTSVPYGEVPTHAAATKEPDETYAYEFDAWTPEPVAVTGNATYKATFTAIPAVASVTSSDGTNYYTSIDDAFTAAKTKNVATIKMLRDVELGDASVTYNVAKTCTLDLNGHTISGTNKRLLEINNASANFTITDNSDSKLGKLSMSTSNNSGAAFCVLVDNGNLYLDAGTIYLQSTSTDRNAVGVRVNAEGTFTMNGGTAHVKMTQSGRVGYSTQSLGAMTINGGELRAESANGEAYAMYVTGTMTVNGGKFHVTGATALISHSVSTADKLLIKGGYYNTNSSIATFVAPGKSAWNYYLFSTTAAEKAEVGSDYNYKVAEAYTVTFKDGDNNTIQTGLVEKNTTPAYTGATPTKAADAQYTYKFNNTWYPAISAVTAAATYTAQFDETPQVYAVTLHTNEGTINAGNVKSYTYGMGATLPTNVTRTGKDFIGWYDNSDLTGSAVMTISAIATGDKEYWAKWEVSKYTITWLNWDGSDLAAETITSSIEYNGMPGYNVNNPVPEREASNGRTYAWDGWTTAAYGAGTFYAEGSLPQATGDATYYAHYRIQTIEVEKSADIKLEENESANVETTTVHVQGSLTVSTSATLSTDALILEGTPTSSGEIIGAGNVTATRAYFDFSNGTNGFKAKTWYAVAVPWLVYVPVSELGGVYLKKGEGDYVQQRLGKTYDLIYYDGARRATGANKAWNYVEDDQLERGEHDKMEPGLAYMIYLTSDADVIRFEMTGDDLHTPSIKAHKYGDKNTPTTLANWNGIANPATYHAYLNVGATEGRGQVYNGDTKQYEIFDMSANKLVVGQPIFVQSTVEGTVVANSSTYTNPSSSAPRRVKEALTPFSRYEFVLAPSEADETDRIIVRMSEDKEENNYVVGQDLVKMGVSDRVPQMWIDRYDSKMCINTVAPINNTADYPLGISVQKDGEYDLFIDDQPDDNTMLYLTYDGEAIWNLSYGGYVAYLNKGTNNHYGLRIVYSAPKITTGIEEATIQNGEAIRKVIVNDQVFIIRNGEMYSIDGQLVK